MFIGSILIYLQNEFIIQYTLWNKISCKTYNMKLKKIQYYSYCNLNIVYLFEYYNT